MPAFPVTSGFWGKLPARGDFVRSGLSRGFTEAWDGWINTMLAASRADLGATWHTAWLAAPVWRFCLRPKLCGPNAAIGLFLPSLDRAGQPYPLTFAAEFNIATTPGPAAIAWLDAAELAGRAAISDGLIPQSITARLPELDADPEDMAPTAASWWWSDGSPTIPADEICLATMPSHTHFATMLAGERLS